MRKNYREEGFSNYPKHDWEPKSFANTSQPNYITITVPSQSLTGMGGAEFMLWKGYQKPSKIGMPALPPRTQK